MFYKKKIVGWGRSVSADAEVFEPGSLSELKEGFDQSETWAIHGNSRAYGDAALGKKVLSSKGLNQILDWDNDTGIIICQSGVTLDAIIQKCVPNGYFLGVTPGTKFITVGGAIASDVHGKNHHIVGTFSRFVQSFEMLGADGQELHCSRSENQDLFYEAMGGMGLNGFIYAATIQLKEIPSAYISQKVIAQDNLAKLLAAIEANDSATYAVAWIDIRRKGRGVLFLGEHTPEEDLNMKQKSNPFALGSSFKIKVPRWMPGIFINRLTVGIFNAFYFWLNSRKKQSVVHFDPYFYPLDGLSQWNHLYGKSGFIQYQFVVNYAQSQKCLEEFIKVLNDYNQYAFVTVLKQFGEKYTEAFNSFPQKGITLAVDLKREDRTTALVKALDSVILKYKGVIYRSKDALSSKELMPIKIENKNTKFATIQSERLA